MCCVDHNPNWIDYQQVSADLADDGVAAPPEFVDGLRQVVADADAQGLDLKIVYTEAPASVYTQARDLATMLGQDHQGTVLVRTPLFVGSYSDTLPRARLEAGQDDAFKEIDPVLSAVVFENKVLQPGPSWPAVAGVLVLVLVVAIAVLAVLIRRRGA